MTKKPKELDAKATKGPGMLSRFHIYIERMWCWGYAKASCDCRFLDIGPVTLHYESAACSRPYADID